MFKWLFSGGRRRNQPAASDSDDTNPDTPIAMRANTARPQTINGYEDHPHNVQARRILSKEKFDVLKRADAKSKAKYDQIDAHIEQLKEVREKIKRCRAARRSACMVATASPVPSAD